MAAQRAETLRRVPDGTVVGNQPGTHPPALEVDRVIGGYADMAGIVGAARDRDGR